jgi:hypothetical protein
MHTSMGASSEVAMANERPVRQQYFGVRSLMPHTSVLCLLAITCRTKLHSLNKGPNWTVWGQSVLTTLHDLQL